MYTKLINGTAQAVGNSSPYIKDLKGCAPHVILKYIFRFCGNIFHRKRASITRV